MSSKFRALLDTPLIHARDIAAFITVLVLCSATHSPWAVMAAMVFVIPSLAHGAANRRRAAVAEH